MAKDGMTFRVKPEWAWIPVSQRLPEPGTNAIVTARLGSGQLVVRAAAYSRFGWSGNGNFNDVLAWIPMPGPYKEDEENE